MRKSLRVTALSLAAMMAVVSFGVSASAETPAPAANPEGSVSHAAKMLSYDEYKELFDDAVSPQQTVAVDLSAVKAEKEAAVSLADGVAGKDGVLKWEGQTGKAEFPLSVPESGFYRLRMTYMPILKTNRNIEFSLLVDGKMPYSNVRGMELDCVYRNEAWEQDNRGNDLTPRQIKQAVWTTASFMDPEGLYDDPLQVYFEAGEHVLTLDVEMGAFYIAALELYNEPAPLSYEEQLKLWQAAGAQDATADPIRLEGEKALDKSETTLLPKTDRTDAATSPNSPSVTKLNTISSGKAGQWMTWQFEVPESGFYKLGLRFRQQSFRGFFVTRRIYINGKVPFAEMNDLRFKYDGNWQYMELGDPYKIYLEKGPCEIKMEVVLGEFSDIVRDLSAVVQDMNDLYRKIIMITGVTPDTYRDYALDKQIDGFVETMDDMAKRLRRNGEKMEKLAGSSGGSEAATLFEMSDQLDSFCAQPETVASRLDSYSSNISTLSAWIFSKQEQPMEIDYLRVSAPDAAPDNAGSGFFQNIWFRMQAVFYSFFTDYSAVGNVYEGADGQEALTVWIGGGSDQAGVAKTMIDDLFVAKTGIPVNLKLVQGSVIEATFAGQGPDIVLNSDATTIINLAARGELVALSDYEDFEEATKVFYPETLVPYQHLGKVYGLPITYDFSMMFYRTDIFEELELTPPQTWQEFVEVVSVLQANNMQAGISNMFITMMLQNEIPLYNEDLSATNFDKPEAVEAFKTAMQFFTQSTLPDVFDFYNRFRTGEMPLGIQGYSQFNMLSSAAPEIRNLWEMVPIPGTPQEDGTINRAQSGAGSATVMFKHMKDNESAWEFLKWWSSAEAQERYGRDLEMIMGLAARYTPANPEALRRLPWSNHELDNLLAQWEEVKGVPTIPAGYYLDRGLTNAFRNVLYSNENPREALFYQNRLINKEITRKRVELGID